MTARGKIVLLIFATIICALLIAAKSAHVKSISQPAADTPDTPAVSSSDYQALAGRGLLIPVQGARLKDIRDTFNEGRGDHRHEATDIMAPRGTAVLAVDDGVVKKLFNSKPGGLTIYQFDPTGSYCYYYGHLDGYAEGVKEGLLLKRGDKIGYVGTTGDAPPNTPHLHFAIFKLGPEKKWWKGTPINPYPLLTASLGRR